MGATITKSSDHHRSAYDPVPPSQPTTTAFDIESGTHRTKPHEGEHGAEYVAQLAAGAIAVMVFIMMVMLAISCDDHAIQCDPRVHIESASVSLFNLSTSHEFSSLQWNISFSITNPNNDTTLFYDNLEVSVLYKTKLLSVTILEPFYQGKKENSSVEASLASTPGVVGDWIASAIARDMTLFRAMDFDVGLRGSISCNPGEKFETHRGMTASCKDVKIDFTPTTTMTTKVGVMSGRLRNCSVIVEKY